MAGFKVKIENVVVFVSLGEDISLSEISDGLESAEYAPESFPGVVYRIKDPRATALIFSSGKIVCTGARSIDLAREAVKKVISDMRKIGVKLPTKFDMNVENIVASTRVDTEEKLNLEDICINLENAEYEPEQFPGLVYRIQSPRVAFLLFRTGKIICTGARNVEDIHLALSKLKKRLKGMGIKFKVGEGK